MKMKAIFVTGGKQYYVSEGETIYVEKLDAEVGSEVEFTEGTMASIISNFYLIGHTKKEMKTIDNKMVVRMNTWNNTFDAAKIVDMGCDDYYKNFVDDTNRVYASNRSLFLSNDPRMYDIENAKYANPVELINGEIVKLATNGKLYRVVDMTNGKWENISDPIHFELVN